MSRLANPMERQRVVAAWLTFKKLQNDLEVRYVGQKLKFCNSWSEMPSKPDLLGRELIVDNVLISNQGEISVQGHIVKLKGDGTIWLGNYIPIGFFFKVDPRMRGVQRGHIVNCPACGTCGNFDPTAGKNARYMAWVKTKGCYKCAPHLLGQ